MGNALSKAYPNLELEPDSCASDEMTVEIRPRFPPFPGNYQVLRYNAPVAICTLNSKELISEIAHTKHSALGLIGSLNTENLGIERVVKNTISNPNIRFLILCGDDSQQKIGHLPGQSLLSLFQNGVDEKKRIVGAQGKRPVLKNVELFEIQQFLSQVEVIDLIGKKTLAEILRMTQDCGQRNKGPFEGASVTMNRIEPIKASPPKPLILDPNGYFVIFPDQKQNRIIVEHYLNTGVLNKIVEGIDVGSIYMTIIDLGLVSKLDHACYLGKELARAEESLRTGNPYQQDQAQDVPEEGPTSCKAKGCC